MNSAFDARVTFTVRIKPNTSNKRKWYYGSSGLADSTGLIAYVSYHSNKDHVDEYLLDDDRIGTKFYIEKSDCEIIESLQDKIDQFDQIADSLPRCERRNKYRILSDMYQDEIKRYENPNYLATTDEKKILSPVIQGVIQTT